MHSFYYLDSIDQLSSINQNVINLDSRMREVPDLQGAEKLSGTAFAVKRDQLHDWLQAVSTDKILHDAQTARHKGTCEWIFDRSPFQKWLRSKDEKPKILWIHGGPGFGKTILSARLVQWLGRYLSFPVLHFFCAADDKRKREPYAILRSWLDQLIHYSEKALKVIFAQQELLSLREPTTVKLWQMFKAVAQNIPCVFLVDGFDECESVYDQSRRHVEGTRSQFLRSLVSESRGTKAKILIVSRDLEDVRGTLTRTTSSSDTSLYEIAISSDDTKDDVLRCSAQWIDEKLSNKSRSLRTELATSAAVKSEGMFLWLDRVVEDLDPGENAKSLRATVKEMPSEINDTYRRELEKLRVLRTDQRKRTTDVLRWICFAVVPLTVKELAEALVVDVEEAGYEYPVDELPDSWEDRFVDETYINTFI